MNTRLLSMARRHFCSDLVTREINRANARKWVRIVKILAKNGKWKALPTVQRFAEVEAA